MPPIEGAYRLTDADAKNIKRPDGWYIELYDLEDIKRIVRITNVTVIVGCIGRIMTLEVYDADRE